MDLVIHSRLNSTRALHGRVNSSLCLSCRVVSEVAFSLIVSTVILALDEFRFEGPRSINHSDN